jgi:hypothetical protein
MLHSFFHYGLVSSPMLSYRLFANAIGCVVIILRFFVLLKVPAMTYFRRVFFVPFCLPFLSYHIPLLFVLFFQLPSF